MISGLMFSIRPELYSEIIPVNTEVELIDRAGLQKIISERNGKPLLINLWATWCVPCREEFPDLIRFADAYKNSVDVIALSVDYPDEIETKIIPFLSKLNPSFDVYVYSEKNQEALINMLSEKWNGALPATFVYNPESKQVFFHQGKMSYDDFVEIMYN